MDPNIIFLFGLSTIISIALFLKNCLERRELKLVEGVVIFIVFVSISLLSAYIIFWGIHKYLGFEAPLGLALSLIGVIVVNGNLESIIKIIRYFLRK